MPGTIVSRKPRRRPWTDRSGRLEPLKAACFAALLLPGAILIGRLAAGDLGPRPVTELIHVTGLWAVRFLLLSLLVTPLRQAWRLNRLILVRRMIGVAACLYAVTHLFLYVVDQNFALGRVASEIWLRIYLTIGFIALLILAVLGTTSTDAMVRRLGGRRWRLLHRSAYLAMALGAVHFFMQSKANVTEPTWMAGIFLWAMLFRLGRPKGLPALALLAVLAALLTAGGEALYFGAFTRLSGWRILAANLDLHFAPRPAATVLAAGLLVVLGAGLRRYFTGASSSGGGMSPPGGGPM